MSSFLSDYLLLLARKTSSIASDESERVESSVTPDLLVADRSADLMLAVQQVTEDVAARVGAHGQQVHAISTELKAGGCDVASILAG